MLAGIITFFKIWNLFAPIVFKRIILSFSTFENPVYNVIVVTTIEMDAAVAIIPEYPIPTHKIIMGAKAVLGRLFKITM